jgi:3-methyladenine DNA glycosylase/8-oxoguanine DNA glycosylase
MASGAVRNPVADPTARAVERAYGLDHLPAEDEMAALAERRRPYRSLAVGYLFASEFEEGT